MTKKEYSNKLKELKDKYDKSKDIIEKEYIRGLILDLIEEIKKDSLIKVDNLNILENRFKKINTYGLIYEYNLSQNLKEQISIVNSSINASPIHIKKVELKNTAMIQFGDKV